MINRRSLIAKSASKCAVCKFHASEIVALSNSPQPLEKDYVLLCKDCNNLFGLNPKKWKKIKAMQEWLWTLVKHQESQIEHVNSKGLHYSYASPELRNYLINANWILEYQPNKYDTLDAFKHVLEEDVQKITKSTSTEMAAIVIDLNTEGMKRRQKRDYWNYLDNEIVNDYLHIFNEIHLLYAYHLALPRFIRK